MNHNSDKNTREEIARRQLQNFSRNRSVLIGYRGESGRAEGIASGTLVQTPSGNICILTVRHIFDDWSLEISQNSSRVSILMDNSAPLEGCIHGFIVHPDWDVMLIVLSQEKSKLIKNAFLPYHLVSLDFEDILPSDCFFLAGFPFDLEATDFDQRVQDFPYLMIAYGAQDLNTTANRMILEWKNVEEDSSALLDRLKTPNGLSGSPLWKCRAPDNDTLWSYDAVTRLVGIQESWHPVTKEIFIVPLENWYSWFSESMEKIDEHLHNDAQVDVRHQKDG